MRSYYRALFRRFGAQHWWPGDTPFEVMVGAILTQNTAWTNVEKAIANLKKRKLLNPHRLHAAPPRTIASVIRPSGYFNVKARRLKHFLNWFVGTYGADLRKVKKKPTTELRKELLAVNGIGRETADSILLYALDIPTFVIDTYTYRVLTRHELVPHGTGYDEMKAFMERSLPPDRALFNEFHALIVMTGKDFCRTVARCEACPLRRFLPGKKNPPPPDGGGGIGF